MGNELGAGLGWAGEVGQGSKVTVVEKQRRSRLALVATLIDRER